MRHSTTDPGDDTGFAAYVAANTTRLIHLAELLTGNPHDAPDLVQSALIKVYPRWSRIEADDPTGCRRRPAAATSPATTRSARRFSVR